MNKKTFFPVITQYEKSMPFYVSTVGINYEESRIIRQFGLPDFQLLFCREGSGRVELDGRRIDLYEGDVLFLDKNTGHSYYKTSDNWITDWITYNGCGVRKVSRLKSGVYNFENFAALVRLVHKTAHLGGGAQWSVKSSVYLYNLLLLCESDAASADFYSQRFAPVAEFVDKHYGGDIALDDISAILGVSNEHACTMFKNSFGMRPTEYINKVRIQKSKEMLAESTSVSVAETAKSCGFNSSSYFVSKFKQLEGITPLEFRNLQNRY